MELPYSQACDNNKGPILAVLKRWINKPTTVFEIGAGTGQHSVYFAANLPDTRWVCGDLQHNLRGIRAWHDAYPQANLAAPLEFDMSSPLWPGAIDAVYSSNTAHIMPWPLTQAMVAQSAQNLPPGGLFFLYGPFNYRGAFTSDSNAHFDAWLKEHNPEQGIRDFEQVNAVAEANALQLLEDNPMPANNRFIIWQKKASR